MSIISKEQHSLRRWSHVCCKKILKLNCSPLQFKMSEVEVCHLWAPSEPALQESISSLTSTVLHDKGGPHWRRLENEVRTVSAREDTVTLLTSSGKQGGCVKTDLRTPGLGGILWSQVVSCQNKLIFFFHVNSGSFQDKSMPTGHCQLPRGVADAPTVFL